MPAQKDIIFLYTVNFPYGNGEPFLHNELPYLSGHFKKVIIIPLKEERGDLKLPENVEVKFLSEIKMISDRKTIFMKNFRTIIMILLSEFVHCKPKFYFFKKIRYYLSELLNAIELSEKSKILAGLHKGDILHYSFWMNSWALALAVLKSNGTINSFVFRVHGFDLYKERWPHDFIPFSHTCHKYVDRIFTVSKRSLDYFQSTYSFTHKASYSYLGSNDHGLNPLPNSDEITLVSCSNIIPLKRLDLIVHILRQVKVKLKWEHFGEGPLRDQVQVHANDLPSNIRVNFHGQVTQNELFDFYKKNAVDFFINVSNTEGLPFSIIEATSFGIPIIATDVGGTSEIANSQTGILIPKNFDPKEVATHLNNAGCTSFRTLEFRSGVREFWERNFSASETYPRFINDLIKTSVEPLAN